MEGRYPVVSISTAPSWIRLATIELPWRSPSQRCEPRARRRFLTRTRREYRIQGFLKSWRQSLVVVCWSLEIFPQQLSKSHKQLYGRRPVSTDKPLSPEDRLQHEF